MKISRPVNNYQVLGIARNAESAGLTSNKRKRQSCVVSRGVMNRLLVRGAGVEDRPRILTWSIGETAIVIIHNNSIIRHFKNLQKEEARLAAPQIRRTCKNVSIKRRPLSGGYKGITIWGSTQVVASLTDPPELCDQNVVCMKNKKGYTINHTIKNTALDCYHRGHKISTQRTCFPF